MSRSALARRLESRRLWLIVGIFSSLALLMISANTWWSTRTAHQKISSAAALDLAHGLFQSALSDQDSAVMRAALVRLVHSSDYGFRYLEWRDARGRIRGAAGSYDGLKLPLIADQLSVQLRDWLNHRGDDRGRLNLEDGDQLLGWVLYVRDAPGDLVELNADTRRLAALSLLAGGLALVLLAFCCWRWWRYGLSIETFAARAQLPEGVSGERRTPEAPISTGHGLPRRADLGMAFDQLRRGVIIVDADLRVRYLNRTASRLTGWSEADALGSLVYSVVHPLGSDDRPLPTPAETSLKSGQEQSMECLLRARDGTIYEVDMHAAAFGSGPTQSALMYFSDASSQRARIEALKRESQLTQGVIDHLVEGVMTCDEAGVIEFANARALRMFGYRMSEIRNVPVTKLLPVPFLNSPDIKLTDFIAARSGRAQPKVVGWRKDATTFPIELIVERMTLNGSSQGLLLLVRDITDRLRSENLSLRLGRLLDASAQEIYIFDANSLYFTEVNQGARRNLGYRSDELARMTPLTLAKDMDADLLHAELDRLRAGEVEAATMDISHLRSDGSFYPIRLKIQYSRDEEPPVFLAIGVAESGA